MEDGETDDVVEAVPSSEPISDIVLSSQPALGSDPGEWFVERTKYIRRTQVFALTVPSPIPLTSPKTAENTSLRRSMSSDRGVWPSSTASFCSMDWTYGARSGSGRLWAM